MLVGPHRVLSAVTQISDDHGKTSTWRLMGGSGCGRSVGGIRRLNFDIWEEVSFSNR